MPWKNGGKGGKSALIILSTDRKLFTISSYICTLSSFLKNSECHKVSGRQSYEFSEHLLSSIGSFSAVLERNSINFLLASPQPPFSPVDIQITIRVALAVKDFILKGHWRREKVTIPNKSANNI